MVFDHIGFNVRDFAKSRAFYVAALAPLGITVLKEGEGWALIGRQGEGMMWIGSFGEPATPVHIAFHARNREDVRRFHAAALAAGGATTARRACVRNTIPTTTAPSCSTRTGTTSRRFATIPGDGVERGARNSCPGRHALSRKCHRPLL